MLRRWQSRTAELPCRLIGEVELNGGMKLTSIKKLLPKRPASAKTKSPSTYIEVLPFSKQQSKKLRNLNIIRFAGLGALQRIGCAVGRPESAEIFDLDAVERIEVE